MNILKTAIAIEEQKLKIGSLFATAKVDGAMITMERQLLTSHYLQLAEHFKVKVGPDAKLAEIHLNLCKALRRLILELMLRCTLYLAELGKAEEFETVSELSIKKNSDLSLLIQAVDEVIQREREFRGKVIWLRGRLVIDCENLALRATVLQSQLGYEMVEAVLPEIDTNTPISEGRERFQALNGMIDRLYACKQIEAREQRVIKPKKKRNVQATAA